MILIYSLESFDQDLELQQKEIFPELKKNLRELLKDILKIKKVSI
jgi:hypothetical protein